MKRLSNMTADEINALTREQLISRILELEPPPPSDWHSWMDAMLHIALHHYPVEIERELVLGNQPPRADFLVLMENEIVDLGLQIFKIFLEHNIIEFKSPDDELSEEILWKCIGYAGFYIHFRRIPADKVTLTLIRAAKPIDLFKALGQCVEPDRETKGIYHIKNWRVDLPIQIVVTSELDGPEYAGFRAISNSPNVQDVTQMFRNHRQETDPELIDFYRAYWNISSRLTGEVLEEAKRREPDMARTIFDIFKPEIDEKIKEDRRQMLYEYVQDGDMDLDKAARRIGMSPDDFTQHMTEAGYSVPKMA